MVDLSKSTKKRKITLKFVYEKLCLLYMYIFVGSCLLISELFDVSGLFTVMLCNTRAILLRPLFPQPHNFAIPI